MVPERDGDSESHGVAFTDRNVLELYKPVAHAEHVALRH
jgi:hypothetical protein